MKDVGALELGIEDKVPMSDVWKKNKGPAKWLICSYSIEPLVFEKLLCG